MGDLGEEARVRVAVRLRPYNEKEKLTTVTASSGGDKVGSGTQRLLATHSYSVLHRGYPGMM